MTKRTSPKSRVQIPLTDLENEVMGVVWKSQPCSVDTVYSVVSRSRDLKETTVRTLLRRLEAKGYLRHETDGRAYVYSATEPSHGLAARAVRKIIDRFCHGSLEQLVSGMVEAKVLSQTEINQLGEFIRNSKKKES
jgi:predicted transcriptional regulator